MVAQHFGRFFDRVRIWNGDGVAAHDVADLDPCEGMQQFVNFQQGGIRSGSAFQIPVGHDAHQGFAIEDGECLDLVFFHKVECLSHGCLGLGADDSWVHPVAYKHGSPPWLGCRVWSIFQQPDNGVFDRLGVERFIDEDVHADGGGFVIELP